VRGVFCPPPSLPPFQTYSDILGQRCADDRYELVGGGACLRKDSTDDHGPYHSTSVDSSDKANCEDLCDTEPLCNAFDDRSVGCLWYESEDITHATNDREQATNAIYKCYRKVPIDCVESTAARSTCTAVDQELYTVTTAAAYGGNACTGSSTKCVLGDVLVCTCPNGTPTIAMGAAGTLCATDGEDCSACATGYHLSGAALDSTATTCVGKTLSRLDPHTEYTSRFNLSILKTYSDRDVMLYHCTCSQRMHVPQRHAVYCHGSRRHVLQHR
jgi:hypothetical protein